MRGYEVEKVNNCNPRGIYNVAYYRVLNSNRCIAVTNTYDNPQNGLTEIAIIEEHKVPLYKQAMDMQIGRKPRTVTQSQKIIRVRQITIDEVNTNNVTLYIVRV